MTLRLFLETTPREYTEYPGRLLQVTGRWGREEASYLSRVAPAQMQILVSHDDAAPLNAYTLPPNRFVKVADADGATVCAGVVADVQDRHDYGSRRHITAITTIGVLARMASEDYETAIRVEDDVAVSDAVNDALALANYPYGIVRPTQARIHPAGYLHVLGPGSKTTIADFLREMETAEVGLLHEQRGDTINFEGRTFREDKALELDAKWRVGTSEGALRPIAGVAPKSGWTALYTVVGVGLNLARILEDAPVFDWAAAAAGGVTIAPGQTLEFTANLADATNRVNDNVASVLRWTEIQPGGLQLARVALQDIPVSTDRANVSVEAVDRRRCNVTIHNPQAYALRVQRLVLNGFGVALHGDITIPEVSRNVEVYGRRTLDIPLNLTKDVARTGVEDVKGEVQAFVNSMLSLYSSPRRVAQIQLNAIDDAEARRALADARISDTVIIEDNIGAPAGQYFIEGGSIEYDAGQRRLVLTLTMSERGRRHGPVGIPGYELPPPDDAGAAVAALLAPIEGAGGMHIDVRIDRARLGPREPIFLRADYEESPGELIQSWTTDLLPIRYTTYLPARPLRLYIQTGAGAVVSKLEGYASD